MSISIQDLLRDKPPVMVLDMGLGSREQSLPVHDSEPMLVIGSGPPVWAKTDQAR